MAKLDEKRNLAVILGYLFALFLAYEIFDVLEHGLVKDLAGHDVPAALLRESCSYEVMKWLATTGLAFMIGVVPYIWVKRHFGEKQPPRIQGPKP